MPAVSKKQRVAAAIAEHHPEKATGAAKQMAASMSKDQLHHFAATKETGLPEKKAWWEQPVPGVEKLAEPGYMADHPMLRAVYEHPYAFDILKSPLAAGAGALGSMVNPALGMGLSTGVGIGGTIGGHMGARNAVEEELRRRGSKVQQDPVMKHPYVTAILSELAGAVPGALLGMGVGRGVDAYMDSTSTPVPPPYDVPRSSSVPIGAGIGAGVGALGGLGLAAYIHRQRKQKWLAALAAEAEAKRGGGTAGLVPEEQAKAAGYAMPLIGAGLGALGGLAVGDKDRKLRSALMGGALGGLAGYGLPKAFQAMRSMSQGGKEQKLLAGMSAIPPADPRLDADQQEVEDIRNPLTAYPAMDSRGPVAPRSDIPDQPYDAGIDELNPSGMGTITPEQVAALTTPKADPTAMADLGASDQPIKFNSATRAEDERMAFVNGFFDKCAEMHLDPDAVTRMVYGICSRECDARDAFETFVKKAFDLGTLPQPTTPAPVPNRNDVPAEPAAPDPKADEKKRAREKMMKRYASAEGPGFSMADFLATPIELHERAP